MIVDTSAIIAILIGEPDQDALTRLLALAPSRQMSAGSWVELEVVLSRRRDRSLRPRLDELLRLFPIDIAPVTVEQAEIGAVAYRTYGKGNHPARLNFGDCFAYALAKSTGQPLLFKGDDFIHTDIAPVA
ncbi:MULTISPECIES: type II toxin-antitoxin system VapC family toxin [unclassified Sphingomonas]|uniref:type II toxin-antitoxin system VapC family toxin n=1 Tax=unclassified Sphingomonas TaxID=196159 RepID=UPI000831A9BC|nr:MULTISPECIES: type II toxin-antitoxin system VapC family toxin [unclassified Sphingomonas]